MQKILITMLLLATVALSSSNILPVLAMSELPADPLGFDSQHRDNTFSNKYQTRSNLNDILINIEPGTREQSDPRASYANNKMADESYGNAWKNNNYNVKGFRKEQWHNYPRQLDRLNRHLYESHDMDKRNLDPDDPTGDYDEDTTPDSGQNNYYELRSNELQDPEEQNIDKAKTAAAIINPLIILKIHLACLKKNKDYQYPLEDTELRNVKLDDILDDSNPKENMMKVKRERKEDNSDAETKQSPKGRMMNKRIFSLWSRLQSLNQRGHELHHRRHLYALYGLPDEGGAGAGVLTAETRATFMRPPGSPLRWG